MNRILEEYNKDKFSDTYRKLIKVHSISAMEAALASYHFGMHCGMPFEKIAALSETEDGQPNTAANEVLNFIQTAMIHEEDKDAAVHSAMGIYQYTVQVERWKRSKQTYVLDADFVSELARTDTGIKIPYNVFHTLPHSSFYLDFSANEDFCKECGADGALIQVQAIQAAGAAESAEFWLILSSVYREGVSTFVSGQVIRNDKDNEELSLETLTDAAICAHRTVWGTELNFEKLSPMLMQALLYLCSYEPDIRESVVSKQRFRQAKKAKKKGVDLPEREYQVGERFGEAFRKWTKGSLGQSSQSTGTGSHKRPHIRRAHWHRYWVGKRGEQQLVIKWVSECFCGISEQEADAKLDSVSHKVRKPSKKEC